MNSNLSSRCFVGPMLCSLFAIAMAAPAAAQPSFISADPRLPNPDRPYVMSSGSPEYGSFVFVDDLEIRITNPDQLDTPTTNMDGDLEFDSTFDIAYSGILSVGFAPPVHITGVGTARARGIAPGDTPVLGALVYDTELLMLNLEGNAFYSQFRLRESPTLSSTGVTTTEELCLACSAPFGGPIRISSFFDVFAEVSLDGGVTWAPGNRSFHIVQTPEPGAVWLVLCGCAACVGSRRRHA